MLQKAARTWHYAGADKKQRTATAAELRELFAAGTITGSTLVWAKGEAGWARLDQVPSLSSSAADTNKPPPPKQARRSQGGRRVRRRSPAVCSPAP